MNKYTEEKKNDNDNNNNERENDVDVVVNSRNNKNNNENNQKRHRKNKNKQKRSCNSNDNENKNDIVVPEAEENKITEKQQWQNTLLDAQSQMAIVLLRRGKLTNRNAQTFVGCEKTKIKNCIFYSCGADGVQITKSNLKMRLRYIMNHSRYGIFFSNIKSKIYAKYKQVKAIRNDDDIWPDNSGKQYKAIDLFVANTPDEFQNTLVEDLQYDDIDALVSKPLENIANEEDGLTKNVHALSALWKEWENNYDTLLNVFREAHLMSKGHFATLAQILFPDEWNELIHDDDTNIETTIKKLTPLVLSDAALNEYNNKFNDVNNNDVTVDPAEVQALRDQLKKFLIIRCTYTEKGKKKSSWETQAYQIILIGFFVPLLLINHAPCIERQDNGATVPSACICHSNTNPAAFYRNCTHLVSLICRWFRFAQDSKLAGRQLQGSLINTVYPLSFKLLLEDLKKRPGTVYDLLRWICMLGSFVYCLWYEKCIQGSGNGLSTSMRGYVLSRGDWLHDEFWDRQPMTPIPMGCKPARMLAVQAPLTDIIPFTYGKKFGVYLNSKLGKIIERQNWKVGLVVDEWIYGYNALFTNSSAFKYGMEACKLFMEWFKKHGYPTIDTEILEIIYIFIFKNSRHCKFKLPVILELGQPCNPRGRQVKWLEENFHDEFNRRMLNTLFSSYMIL